LWDTVCTGTGASIRNTKDTFKIISDGIRIKKQYRYIQYFALKIIPSLWRGAEGAEFIGQHVHMAGQGSQIGQALLVSIIAEAPTEEPEELVPVPQLFPHFNGAPSKRQIATAWI
jgi:hypothetical protein